MNLRIIRSKAIHHPLSNLRLWMGVSLVVLTARERELSIWGKWTPRKSANRHAQATPLAMRTTGVLVTGVAKTAAESTSVFSERTKSGMFHKAQLALIKQAEKLAQLHLRHQRPPFLRPTPHLVTSQTSCSFSPTTKTRDWAVPRIHTVNWAHWRSCPTYSNS
jgi:hypothetical protein